MSSYLLCNFTGFAFPSRMIVKDTKLIQGYFKFSLCSMNYIMSKIALKV